MLDWLADAHDCPEAARAALILEKAIADTLASGTVMPYEFGGKTGTRAMTDAVYKTLSNIR